MEQLKKRILAAAQEAGGANLLAPVIRELSHRQGTEVWVIACGNASRIFSDQGIVHHCVDNLQIEESSLRGWVGELLDQVCPDVMLLATAWGQSLEKILLKAARGRQIPSLSIVDNWSYFKERFTDPQTGQMCLPALVGVLDEWAHRQAMQEGIPAESLVVTGHPHLEALADQLKAGHLQREAHRLRRQWLGLGSGPEGSRVVLFASEAFSRFAGPETPYYRGYTEVEVLEGLVEVVSQLEQAKGLQVKILVKLHPRESADSYRMGPLAHRRNVPILHDESPWACLLASDAVLGMSSMLLVEAALAGIPSISFQPGAQQSHPFLGCRSGWVQPAASASELRRLLEESLLGPPQERGVTLKRVYENSTSRVVKILLELAQGAEVPR